MLLLLYENNIMRYWRMFFRNSVKMRFYNVGNISNYILLNTISYLQNKTQLCKTNSSKKLFFK